MYHRDIRPGYSHISDKSSDVQMPSVHREVGSERSKAGAAPGLGDAAGTPAPAWSAQPAPQPGQPPADPPPPAAGGASSGTSRLPASTVAPAGRPERPLRLRAGSPPDASSSLGRRRRSRHHCSRTHASQRWHHRCTDHIVYHITCMPVMGRQLPVAMSIATKCPALPQIEGVR